MDRRKNMCCRIVPIYYGDRPAATRGKPNEGKDYNQLQSEFWRLKNFLDNKTSLPGNTLFVRFQDSS